MNTLRRREIERLLLKLEELSALRDSIRDDIDTIRGEEEEYYDNMPESLQSGDKGSKAQEAVDALQSAYDELDQFMTDDIASYLETAKE